MIKIEFSNETPDGLFNAVKGFVAYYEKVTDVLIQSPLEPCVQQEQPEVEKVVSPFSGPPQKHILSEAVGFVPAVPSSPNVDKHGTVYDPTKHSSSMTLNKDGSWKAKKVFNTQPVKVTPVSTLPEETVSPPSVIPEPLVTTFNNFKINFFLIMNQLVSEGKITREYIEQLKTYFKIKEIWNVLGDEKKCLELFDTFCSAGLIVKVSNETNN